jgi:nitroimidazol reductase NimA-like FMN-containing flavoprotein (pyridoxamine 5'-phosphate oxidase superfamily)
METPGTRDEMLRVRRLPERGRYDRETIDAILDEALICHVGFVDRGQPFVIPTLHARVGRMLYLHGSRASRTLRSLRSGVAICVTATVVDGLVLARSAFHHSMNYRSVVVLGVATEIAGEEKLRALRAIADHVVPGRWDDVRLPNETELRATSVLRVPLDRASAKLRVGPPKDDEADLDLPVWAGELPLRTVPLQPRADGAAEGLSVPAYLANWTR